MPSLAPAQQLRRLDKSSTRFPGQISKLIHGQKYTAWVNNLHEDDPVWVVEYFDDVLRILQPESLAFWTCLHELRAICGSWKILPQSHTLSTSLLNVTERPIATRGPCDVHEAFLNGSKVWVKRLRIYSTAGPKDVERDFCQEVITWKHLTHPNIVPLLGVTVAPFQSVSVWMPGGELLDYISSHPHVDRLGLLSDVACGLNYLHSRNVVHGDLKGPSIIVDDAGIGRLTDFGLSRVVSGLDSAAPMTDGHAVRWTAPEVLDMEQPVTKASDVYSFAMVIVEIFTEMVPFYDSTPTTVIVDVLSGCRPYRPTNPNLTDDLWELTCRCWDHKPRRRPKISEVIIRLGADSASPCGDRVSLDGTTLGTFRQKKSLFAASHKLRGFLGFSKTPTPRSPPSKDLILDVNAQPGKEEQHTDVQRESFSASNQMRRNGGCLSKYKTCFKRNCYGCPSTSWGKGGVPTGDRVYSTPSLVSHFPSCT